MELQNSTEIIIMASNSKPSTRISSLSSNPLFSTIITLYILLLLYTPNFTLFLKITLSPVFTSTGILLLFLLRLGAIQRNNQNPPLTPGRGILEPGGELIGEDENHKWVCLNHCTEPEVEKQGGNDGDGDDPKWVHSETDSGLEYGSGLNHSTEAEEEKGGGNDGDEDDPNWVCSETDSGLEYGSGLNHCTEAEEEKGGGNDGDGDDPKWVCLETGSGLEYGSGLSSFCLDWSLRSGAPLEIIYEEYEGEEEEEEEERNDGVSGRIDRYPSLSRYYPESDSDSSLDDDFPVIGDWDSPERMLAKWEEEEREEMIEFAFGKEFQVEEDNLIEIDISPTSRR